MVSLVVRQQVVGLEAAGVRRADPAVGELRVFAAVAQGVVGGAGETEGIIAVAVLADGEAGVLTVADRALSRCR